MASVAARSGRVNEDFAGATASAAVVVDGAGIPGLESVCRHGVAWYASRLGGTLLGLLTLDASGLTKVLADAIERVTDEHRDTCDVANPIGPSAAVAILRQHDGIAEYLVLGDISLVLERPDDEPLVVTDPREVIISRAYESALRATATGSDEYHRIIAELRTHRNHPDGFWLAKDDPRAADQAISGTCAAPAAALLSNGASRLVDRFRLTDWPGLMAILAACGPGEVIDRVRSAEARHAMPPDDATIIHWGRSPHSLR